MFEWAHEMLANIRELILAGAWVVGVGFVLWTFAKSRGQLIPTAVSALMAGAMIWAVHNPEWFERTVGEETIAHAPVVDVADEPAGGGAGR